VCLRVSVCVQVCGYVCVSVGVCGWVCMCVFECVFACLCCFVGESVRTKSFGDPTCVAGRETN